MARRSFILFAALALTALLCVNGQTDLDTDGVAGAGLSVFPASVQIEVPCNTFSLLIDVGWCAHSSSVLHTWHCVVGPCCPRAAGLLLLFWFTTL